jgi:hypothetical protein
MYYNPRRKKKHEILKKLFAAGIMTVRFKKLPQEQ